MNAAKSLRAFKWAFVGYSILGGTLVREVCASICKCAFTPTESRGQSCAVLRNGMPLCGDRASGCALSPITLASRLPQSWYYRHAPPRPTFYTAYGRSKLGPHYCLHAWVVSYTLEQPTLGPRHSHLPAWLLLKTSLSASAPICSLGSQLPLHFQPSALAHTTPPSPNPNLPLYQVNSLGKHNSICASVNHNTGYPQVTTAQV